MPPRSKAKGSTDRTPARALLLPYERNLTEYEALAPSKDARRIFAIDPGTGNVATCVIDLDPSGNVVDTIANKYDAPKFQTVFAKVHYIERALANWIAEYKPDLIVKEGIAYAPNGVALAGRLQHIFESLAFEYSLPYVTVNPSTMRAFVGAKEKSDTKLKVWQRWGVQFDSEDETDAFAIGMTGRALLTGEWALKPKAKKKKKVA